MEKELHLNDFEQLFKTLKFRFENNPTRHFGILWSDVHLKLETNLKKLWSLNQMEITGGEPDVVSFDEKNNEFIFFDCSKESPTGRRSICYDDNALQSRKENKPKNSAIQMAIDMGIEILSEDQYRELQKLDNFDLKTSSWIKTPESIRNLGGAIFCDKRYNSIFLYHNGAESYYAARGFRGFIKI